MKVLPFCSFLFLFLLCFPAGAEEYFREKMIAGYAPGLTLEKAFEHPAWRNVPEYRYLATSANLAMFNRLPEEQGSVKLLYDDNFLYAGFRFEDSDVVDHGRGNHAKLYFQSDLAEICLKSKLSPCIWEIHVTPKKWFCRYFYPSRGRMTMPSCRAPAEVKIPAVVKIEGTLNEWRDRDKSWRIVIAIPLKELESHGVQFDASGQWTILAARYNYSRYLPQIEFSSFPQMMAGYEQTERYAELILEPKKGKK